MSPVEFKKRPCRPVEFKGQGPYPAQDHGTCDLTLRGPTDWPFKGLIE